MLYLHKFSYHFHKYYILWSYKYVLCAYLRNSNASEKKTKKYKINLLPPRYLLFNKKKRETCKVKQKETKVQYKKSLKFSKKAYTSGVLIYFRTLQEINNACNAAYNMCFIKEQIFWKCPRGKSLLKEDFEDNEDEDHHYHYHNVSECVQQRHLYQFRNKLRKNEKKWHVSRWFSVLFETDTLWSFFGKKKKKTSSQIHIANQTATTTIKTSALASHWASQSVRQPVIEWVRPDACLISTARQELCNFEALFAFVIFTPTSLIWSCLDYWQCELLVPFFSYNKLTF